MGLMSMHPDQRRDSRRYKLGVAAQGPSKCPAFSAQGPRVDVLVRSGLVILQGGLANEQPEPSKAQAQGPPSS